MAELLYAVEILCAFHPLLNFMVQDSIEIILGLAVNALSCILIHLIFVDVLAIGLTIFA